MSAAAQPGDRPDTWDGPERQPC